MNAITFVHGWGYAPAFWQNLTPEFSDHKIYCKDLVFLLPATQTGAAPGVFITHSLGTLHALKHHQDDMSALVVINGFYDFTDFASDKTLSLMIRGLDRAPLAQMQAFWRQCGLEPEYDDLDVANLRKGLEILRHESALDEIKNLNIPILCLASEDDPVTPFEAMKSHWHGFPLISSAQGGHILAHSRADWCAAQIKGFIREHKLEQ